MGFRNPVLLCFLAGSLVVCGPSASADVTEPGTTQTAPVEAAPGAPTPASTPEPVARSAGGRAFNPDISANFLGLLQRGTSLSDDRTEPNRNGLTLQEAELQFTSDVDPYFRASALLSIAQEKGAAGFGVGPEEVYLETISLPSVTIRAGKFKLALGRHNQLHTHAFPFIDAPLIHQALLGDEGLNEVGVSAAVLIPVSWYSEIIFQGFGPSNDTLYKSLHSGDVGGLARLKNLWDLNDDLTLELGLSGTAAKNQFDRTAGAVAADLTFKWRPAEGGKYHALIWSSEYLQGRRPGLTDVTTGEGTENLGGLASWLQYQFAERWWIQGRYEFVGIPHPAVTPVQNKESFLVGFFPSEFSGFRLQYDHLRTLDKDKADHAIALQYNISIGAHPAHAY